MPVRHQKEFRTSTGRTEILRAVGIGVLNEIRSGRRAAPEPKKYAIKKSFTFALQRSCAHLIPCIVSIIIIALNLRGYFIGSELAGQEGYTTIYMALLQVTAKIQELLIISSLATMIFDKTREDLIKGCGVPFGLLGSGISFSQLSYFWSLDFWGALSTRARSNFSLLLLLSVSGLIAATAGPSVAILLIPRVITWPAGAAKFYLNGTASDLWPLQVDLEHHPSDCFGEKNSTASLLTSEMAALCPYGGYSSLRNHYDSSNYLGIQTPWEIKSFSISGRERLGVSGLDKFAPSGVGILVNSPFGLVVPYTIVGSVRDVYADYSVSFGVHGASANLQQRLQIDWLEAINQFRSSQTSTDRLKYFSSQMSIVDTSIPSVGVLCSQGNFMERNKSGDVEFPTLYIKNKTTSPKVNIGGVSMKEIHFRSDYLDSQTESTVPRVQWHRMTPELNPESASTLGIVFESPWVNSTGRYVCGCSIDARWINATSITQEFQSVHSKITTMGKIALGESVHNIFPPLQRAWKNITISQAWLDSLNFVLPADQLGPLPRGTTALEALIAAADLSYNNEASRLQRGNTPKTLSMLENIMASAIADGLSRVASFRSLNMSQALNTRNNSYVYYEKKPDANSRFFTTGDVLFLPSTNDDNYTALQFRETVTGYGYKAHTITDILSLSILFLHLVMAVGHVVYLLVLRRSSSCWDTLSEILALAMQSKPSERALVNTCAGVYRMRNFSQMLHIRAREEHKDHLEFVFHVDADSLRLSDGIDAKSKYG